MIYFKNITNRVVCDMVYETHQIEGIKEQCGSIITNYLNIRNAEWFEVSQDIRNVTSKLAKEKRILQMTPRQIIEELNIHRSKYREDSPVVDLNKYKKIIKEALQQYAQILVDLPENAPIPVPNWPIIPKPKNTKFNIEE